MFRSAATLIGFSVAMAFDNDTIYRNYVDAQYYIGSFNGNGFPLAIGLCNPLDILGSGGSQLAECTNETTLTWSYYSDIDCSTFVSQTVYDAATYQTGTGTLNDFNCDDDGNTSYAEIEFEALGCGAATKVTMNAAIDVCTFTAANDVSIRVYCQPRYAELFYYYTAGATSGVCSFDTLTSIANATGHACGFMLETEGTKVYGQVIDCVGYGDVDLRPTSLPTITPEDSANNYTFTFLSFGLTAILVALKLN